MDDMGFLGELTEDLLNEDAFLFPVRKTEQYCLSNRTASNRAAPYAGPNPWHGALITYYPHQGLGQGSPSDTVAVSVQILDQNGEVIRDLNGPDRQGSNRIAWDLRMESDTATGAGEQGRRRPTMTEVEPGGYTVRSTARGGEPVQTVTVVPDERRGSRPPAISEMKGMAQVIPWSTGHPLSFTASLTSMSDSDSACVESAASGWG
jgi:hypothetical protein